MASTFDRFPSSSVADLSGFGPRPTFLSIVVRDPIFALKATPAVTERRQRLTRVVKGVLAVAAAICVIALGRAAFASSADEEAPAAESSWDADRVVRAVEHAAAKPPVPHVQAKITGRLARRL